MHVYVLLTIQVCVCLWCFYVQPCLKVASWSPVPLPMKECPLPIRQLVHKWVTPAFSVCFFVHLYFGIYVLVKSTQFQLPSGSTASRSSRIATPSVVASEVAVATDGSRAADAWRAAQGARLGLGTWGWVFWILENIREYHPLTAGWWF